MSDFDSFTEDGVEYKICPDCYETRKLTDFDFDDTIHEICVFCSPPPSLPDEDFDSDEGARICNGFKLMGCDDV